MYLCLLEAAHAERFSQAHTDGGCMHQRNPLIFLPLPYLLTNRFGRRVFGPMWEERRDYAPMPSEYMQVTSVGKLPHPTQVPDSDELHRCCGACLSIAAVTVIQKMHTSRT